jgi:hypothetical protein
MRVRPQGDADMGRCGRKDLRDNDRVRHFESTGTQLRTIRIIGGGIVDA